MTSSSVAHSIASTLNRHLVFVHGKGGVGKTRVSEAIAFALSEKDPKTLWITLEDPTQTPGKLTQLSSTLWHLNCDFTLAFEEYVALKIGTTPLSRLFLQNKLVRYLAKAAPGIRELVLLGKIWFERLQYTHVIVDLPSTGYGLAMFQSTENFRKLFHGGPLHKDAEAMLETFHDPQTTGHVILALPEETPLRESLELKEHLKKIFPNNPPAFLVNRVFPALNTNPFLKDITEHSPPESWSSPLAHSEEDYILRRYWLENHNLRLWRTENIHFGKLEFVPPPLHKAPNQIVENLVKQLQDKAYV